MNNPYEPPAPLSQVDPTFNRRPFVLAAIGAWLAAVYWLGMTLLIGLGVAMSGAGGAQLILPLVLIGLYAHRGYRLYQADPAMIRSILVLHLLGMVATIFQITTTKDAFVVTLSIVKIAIHVFGLITALLARRALTKS